MDKQARRTDFASRLKRQMALKGLTQADLSRRAQELAPKGVRIDPDNVSHYLNARYLPTLEPLRCLAQALEMDALELLPTKDNSAMTEVSLPADGIRVRDMSNGMAWLEISQVAPWPVVLKVLELLRGETHSAQIP